VIGLKNERTQRTCITKLNKTQAQICVQTQETFCLLYVYIILWICTWSCILGRYQVWYYQHLSRL